MRKEVVILVTEDNDGHFALTRKLLRRAGIENEIVRFLDGQQTLDFLIGGDTVEAERDKGLKYLLLLDIRMPGISGVDVLEIVKKHKHLLT